MRLDTQESQRAKQNDYGQSCANRRKPPVSGRIVALRPGRSLRRGLNKLVDNKDRGNCCQSDGHRRSSPARWWGDRQASCFGFCCFTSGWQFHRTSRGEGRTAPLSRRQNTPKSAAAAGFAPHQNFATPVLERLATGRPSYRTHCLSARVNRTDIIAPHVSGDTMSFSQRLQEIRDGFERPFWVANISEIFERLAYYGAFASLALYLQERLNFSTQQTGTLTGIFGGMVWFLAIFGGAAADRLGFRRALSSAYLILAVAYFLIGSIGAPWLAPVRNAVPLSLFVGFILVLPALGIALVKPCVVGTTARASKENVRSIGYSIYYTMVNVGGAAGPYFASWAHRHLGVENVYRLAAVSVFAMFFFVLLFFREPRKANDAPPPSITTVARNFCVVVGNYKLVLPVLGIALLLRISMLLLPFHVPWWIWLALLVLALAGISRFMWFLVLFTGFWVVFWQQYVSLPEYIHGYIEA